MDDLYNHHVVTTINNPTAVKCVTTGNFIDPNREDLIVCKGSSIEVYSVLADGLKSLLEFSLNGFISQVQACHIPERSTCSLFVLTGQNYFTIITFNPKIKKIQTECAGKLEEPRSRVTDLPPITAVDIKSNSILISAFTGLLFVIPYLQTDIKGKSKEGRGHRFKPQSLKTNEFEFLSMVSLKGLQESCIAVLLGEINELKTIKTFKYDAAHNTIVEKEKVTVKVESTTHTLVAVPDPIGGVLALGEFIISYHDLSSSERSPKELSIDPALITACTFLRNKYDHCLMCDSEGYLYMLVFDIQNMKVSDLNSTLIGRTTVANSITDLGNGLFYLGSAQGDPCVIRLNQSDVKLTIEVLHTFSNLGPIGDFCVFDYDQQGKQTMVCCSGVDANGSLRIVESGVGFLEQYSLNTPLVREFWGLSSPTKETDTLLISTFKKSFVLQQTGKTQMKEYSQYSALILNDITLATGINAAGHLIQITSTAARIMTMKPNGQLLNEWKPPSGQYIALAKHNTTQCIICCGSGMLIYLDCAGTAFEEKRSKQFEEVACIQLCSSQHGDHVLLGMWTKPTTIILQLPDLEVMLEYTLPQNVGPKDLLITMFEDKEYLLVLFGEGRILSYAIQFSDNVAYLQDERQTMVSTYCTAMYPYIHQGQQKVFVAGNRPTIISSFHGALLFSAVNMKDIYAFGTYNQQIVLMSNDSLLFGQVDANQKLHHTKIRIGEEMPIRIQYMQQAKLLTVGTSYIEKNRINGFAIKKGKIHVLDAQTFQVLDTYLLPGHELVESMTIATFAAYPGREFLFVGTVIENEEEPDASDGRILTFDIKDNHKMELIESVSVPGIVYDIKSFQNSVVACVNGSIHCLDKFSPDLPIGQRASFKINVHKNVLALNLDTRGNRVLVGDLMRSMSVLSVTKQDPLKLELLAVDPLPAWMTAVKFVDDHIFVGADNSNNIFALLLNEHANNNGNILKMELQGGIHVDSTVNCFREGTLTDTATLGIQESIPLTRAKSKPFTFATVSGSIGTIKTISSESFAFFYGLQERILKQSENLGGLSYNSWRSYRPKVNATRRRPIFVDGDVLKRFQYMPESDKQKILHDDGMLSRYSIKEIEDLINSLVS